MFQSPILDVATGLIVVFLVLALVCTSITEYIAQVLSLRAETLWVAVSSLFQNSNKPDEFAKQLYDHNLVDALSPPGDKPSYIPSQVFSLALVDQLGMHTSAAVSANPPQSVESLLNDAKAKNAGKIDGNVFDTLRPLAVAAGNSLDAFRQNIESWFDAAMQRASGWYKRRAQTIIFCVALGVALIFNADALTLADTLWTNPGARTDLAAAGQTLGKAAPPGAANAAAASAVPTMSTPAVQQARSQVMNLIGWSGPIFPWMHGYQPTNAHRFPADFGGWIAKLLGLLITAFAASLGAPFWFGVLSKVMAVRNAGASPNDAKAPQPARIESGGN